MTAVGQCVSPNVRKRVRIVIAALLTAVFCTVGWLLLRQPEPVYSGKPISFWIARSFEYYGHLPQVDSNAIPYLVKALNRQDNPLNRAYDRLWFKLSAQFRLRLPVPIGAEQIRLGTAASLGNLGALAKPAIPALIRAMQEDKSEKVRGAAAWSLGRLGNQEQIVVAALTNALRDNAPSVRYSAAQAIPLCGPAAQTAVPALEKCVADENPQVSAEATTALNAIRSQALKANETVVGDHQ